MTASSRYAVPAAGLPPQTQRTRDRARFTPAYAVIPNTVMRDIVTSQLPGWTDCRAWILARPLSGFAETFAQLIVELSPGGTGQRPEPDVRAQGVIFVLRGAARLSLDGEDHALVAGSYVYIAPAHDWSIINESAQATTLQWIRKRYVPAPDWPVPACFVTHEDTAAPEAMPDTDGVWATQRFVAPDDLGHDMHVNIVTFQPGGVIPFSETHVMEHGIYVLSGRALYELNGDWVEVEAGDFLWLRAFCPQACYAAGPEAFRYLLYKDVNRHPSLTLAGSTGP